MNMIRPWIGSVLLHLFLFAGSLFVFHSSVVEPKVENSVPVFIYSNRASVGLMTESKKDIRSARVNGRHFSKNSKIGSKNLSLRDLGVFSKKGSLPLPSNGNADVFSEQVGSPYAFENQVTTKKSPILLYLFKRIDGALAYPGDLREAGYSGEVNAVLSFDQQGHWIESVEDVKANGLMSRYFRIYLLHRHREIFSEPIPETIWKAEPQTLRIEVRFVFEIVAPEKVMGAQVGPQYSASADPSKFSEVDMDGGQSVERNVISGRQLLHGRKFSFYRVHLASPLAWKLGPITGYGVMPMVGINPGWFLDAASDLIHHRAKIDPLMKYREDPDW